MLIVGLTGSIGMGKSTAAAHLRARGFPVFDADAEVHRLYAGGKAVELIERAFPGTTAGGVIDRAKLSAALLAQPQRFADLEAIVHPLVRADADAFVTRHRTAGAPLIVLDIPLLFETGGRSRVDKVAVVTADPATQRSRVLERPGMSEAKFAAVLAKQVPDGLKRRQADYVIDTGLGMDSARKAVGAIIAELSGENPA